VSKCAECGCKASEGQALYCLRCADNHPQEWVEITRGEIETAFAMADNLTDFGFLVEAKCKAKNGYT
jgi:uncharacterized membrane protein YukC